MVEHVIQADRVEVTFVGVTDGDMKEGRAQPQTQTRRSRLGTARSSPIKYMDIQHRLRPAQILVSC